MSVDKFIRNPLWATLVGALVAAMVVVSLIVFAQSGEAAPQAADERTPYASVSPLIVGGTAVPNGKYPFMAALLDKRRPGDAFDELFCGGTLIDKDSVSTAAHCLVNPKPDKLQVVVGRTALNQNRGQLRSVSRRFIQPRYNGNGYDAAVLKLRRAVKGIKPIKLATAKQNKLEKPGHILTAAGWGVVKQRPGPFDVRTIRMHEVSVPVVSDSRAKRAYLSEGHLAKRIPDTFLEQDDTLYSPKEATERLFILKEGRVQLYEVEESGEEITLSVVEDGNVFGEMALTGQSLGGLYVRALTPSTVVSLRREDVEHLIMNKPEVGLRLVQVLAERLRDSERRYADMVGKDVPARLATQILQLVDSEGVVSSESYRIPTHYTHEQLGSMIGCKRVAVTRAFRKLEEGGTVELKERRIVVKDIDALKGMAEAS